MKQQVLRLVSTDTARNVHRLPHADDAVVRIFDHWVWMMGKQPKRCALGPSRRKAISKALALYDEETLMLAVEGCAASPWHRGENDREREYTDLELILRDEAHIERFAEDGERLRERLKRAEERRAQQPQAAVEPAAEASAEDGRQRLRALAARMSGRSAGAGA